MVSPQRASLICGALLFVLPVRAAEIRLLPEYLRPDPFGAIVTEDRKNTAATEPAQVKLRVAKRGYASMQIVVYAEKPGSYRLRVTAPPPLEVDVFREWFHKMRSGGAYYPDALIPVSGTHESHIPNPDNRIENQKSEAYWLDVWVPAGASPGEYAIQVTLNADGKQAAARVPVTVLDANYPSDDVIAIDHNSYGSTWLPALYPKAAKQEDFYTSAELFRLIHAHHRIFYEHRGLYHQLGYGHAGKVAPEFAPELEGTGRNKRIANWNLFDRHYGPLLDGSAFANTRFGAKPIPFVYLPINPDWPASFLWWGEPGYEAEFVNVVSQMERHFREKGWTQTRFEMFFNHKKRYKGYPWDGDETRFEADLPYFAEYRRLLDKAVPGQSPVKFVFRADASWMLAEQARKQGGVIDFWVNSGTILSWYPDIVEMLKKRGDIVWIYSGTPEVAGPASAITFNPLRAWLWGIDGYIHWLAVSPGPDPWFRFDGGDTAMVYPGSRFGVEAPIPSIRLKAQRNCLQDLALLDTFKKTRPADWLKTEVSKRYNGLGPEDWWIAHPPITREPVQEWSNADIDSASRRSKARFNTLDANAWERVRRFLHELVTERK
ncbi:MAG: DUF4091 domain-containing protein [Bryobacterales bacterium]|nr:DUF4091 domain-containing protein [Bryobacterales bacterium]